MKQASTTTIYDCLGMASWTKRKCLRCQQSFTKLDWKEQNYQLFFKEIAEVKSNLSLNYAVLVGVMVELHHRHCPLAGSLNYQSEITCPQK